jgi:hypothetical protein
MPEYATNKDSMEQSRSAETTPANELRAISERVAEVQSATETLRALELSPATEIEVAIKGLHDISTQSHEAAKSIGLRAVADGHISQARLAQLMEVHQNTAWRWVKEAQEQKDKPR